MRKVAVALAVFGLANSYAFGGLAIFSPPVSEVIQGTGPVNVGVTLQTQSLASGFNGVDILIGSELPFTFAYSQAFMDAMSVEAVPGFNNGIYAFDVLLSGNNASANVGTTLSLGTLTVNTSGAPLGDYALTVDNSFDGFSQLGLALVGQDPVFEALSGSGRISVVVPEPATLSLLGLGLLGFIRRRFAA